MRTLELAIGLVTLATALPAGAPSPWEAYLELPAPENASKVASITYTEGDPGPDRLFEDLAVLELQVASADPEAVRLAFRLLRQSDGHVTEELCTMLGRLIRVDPALFLEELEIHRKAMPKIQELLDSLVGSVGHSYVDRFRAEQYELEQRVRALMGITDEHLVAARNECVARLRQMIREMPSGGSVPTGS